MNPDPDLTIVLLGKSGVGKSASGNTILGRTAFTSKMSFKPVTKQISEATGEMFGKQVSVIDTPGILDTKDTDEKLKFFCQKLQQSSRRCLFLVVVRVGRFTKEDLKAVRAAVKVLGPQGVKNGYLLFTGGDALKGMTLEDFIFEDEEKGFLPDAVRMFAGATQLFNNESDDTEQVRELLLKSGHLTTQKQPDPPADVSKDRRIVLLGLLGAGKSSSGNTILGSEKFKQGCDFNSVSTEAVSESATVDGRRVTVVDTPGFTDRVLNPERLYEGIMKTLVKASPGPHTFVIVVRLGRITNTDIKLFELLPKLFESGACKYSMVLFTHGDELRGRSIDDLIKSNTHVSHLVSMCSGRYCVFDNKANKRREQVRNFFNKVDEMVTANGGEHYSNELFRMAETFIREETYRSSETGGHENSGWKRILPFLKKHKWKIIVAMIAFGLVGGAATGFAVATKIVGTVGVNAAATVGVNTAATVGVNTAAAVGVNAAAAVGVNTAAAVGVNAAATVGVNAAATVGVNAAATVGVNAAAAVAAKVLGVGAVLGGAAALYAVAGMDEGQSKAKSD